jgi:hypothetical protein
MPKTPPGRSARNAWQQRGPGDVLENQRRVDQIVGPWLQLHIGHVTAPQIELDARIQKALTKTKKEPGIDIYDHDACGDSGISVFESVARRTAEDERNFGSNCPERVAQQSIEDQALTHRRAAHVADIIGLWNIEPGIAHVAGVANRRERLMISQASDGHASRREGPSSSQERHLVAARCGS